MLERNPQQLGDKLAQQRVPIGMRAPRFFFVTFFFFVFG
jgi:hypothetical protein